MGTVNTLRHRIFYALYSCRRNRSMIQYGFLHQEWRGRVQYAG